jgi:hypothetical protein
MNTPVNYPIAKLLKEKGFEQNLEVGTICRIQNAVNKSYEKIRPIKQSDLENQWSIFNEVYPTVDEVKWWLYEKHGVWISSTPVGKKFRYEIIPMEKQEKFEYSSFEYNSPTEAYEAAIEYTLNNLI